MTLSTAETTLQSLGALLDPDQITTVEGQSPARTSRIEAAFIKSAEYPPVVYPRSVEQLQALLFWANQDQKTMTVCGNASKLGWGTPIKPTDVIISTRQLNRIIDHAIGDLTITVETGLCFQDLQTQLQATGQMLPIDPAYPSQATIGGIFASRDTGSLRHRYGGVRDLCLGVTFVRADGQIAKGGGRVVKNVAGYDLMKLFTGSFGTLGIMTSMTLRLYPIQESSQTVILSGRTEAIATITAGVLDSTLTPVSIDLLSQEMLKSINIEAELGVVVRFQSLEESVLAQVQKLQDLGQSVTINTYDSDASLWQGFQQTLWANDEGSSILLKVGMLPQSIALTLQTFQSWCQQKDISIQAQILAGWGIGTIKLTGSHSALPQLITQMRQQCEQQQGYLSILNAPMDLRQQQDVWGYPGNAIAPMRKLKDKFDPHHLLNPGRFVGGI